jgi:hypothetical protein
MEINVSTSFLGSLTQEKFSVKDPDIDVEIYNPDKTLHGTTLLANNHKPEKPRIIEGRQEI